MAKNYIRTIRKDRGMTLQELADKVGTSNQQISNHESSKRRLTIEWLHRYAAALECHILDIIEGLNETPVAKDQEEKDLLAYFRSMNDKEQDDFMKKTELQQFRQSKNKKDDS